jgi:hypothetical protein
VKLPAGDGTALVMIAKTDDFFEFKWQQNPAMVHGRVQILGWRAPLAA